MWKTLEFDCSECGCHARNYYRDVDHVEYARDVRWLELGILLCGNCEAYAEAKQREQELADTCGSEFYEPGPYQS